MRLRVAATALALLVAPSARAERREVPITILHVADLHARLEPHLEVAADGGFETVGGFPRLRTVLDRERARAAGAVFTTAGGDTFHGTGPAAWSRGEVVVAPLRALGLDFAVAGTADLAWGAERLAELARRSGLPPTPTVDGGADASSTGAVTLRRGGATVTFVAVPAAPDLASLGRRVADARRRERPDVVVAVIDAGVEAARELAREVPAVDVILVGRSGDPAAKPLVEGGAVIVQSGAGASRVARLDVTASAGRVAVRAFRLLPVTSRVREHRAVKASVERALAPWRERMGRVVGHAATAIVRGDPLDSSADNLVADAIREAAGVQVALTDPHRSPLVIPPGAITEAQLWELVPDDARVKKGWATGRQLRDQLEREASSAYGGGAWGVDAAGTPCPAGLEVTFTAAPPAGQRRVWSVHYRGRPLQTYDSYTIAVVERRDEPAGSLWGIRDAQEVQAIPLTVHEALRRHLSAHAARARGERRFAAIDVVQVARQTFDDDSFQRRSSSW